MRKSGMTARVAAVVLAASMVMTSVLPTFAAENLTVETDDKAAVNGVSKVIGLQGVPYVEVAGELNYVWVNQNLKNDSVYVAGTLESLKDAATGLYKNGDAVYFTGRQISPALVLLSGKVAFTLAEPSYDEKTGLYLVNGKYYENSYRDGKYDATTGEYIYTQTVYSFLESDEVDILGSIPVSYANITDVRNAVKAAFGNVAESPAYYQANGKAYKTGVDGYDEIGIKYLNDEQGKYGACVYASKKYEISLDKKYQRISWNKVSNETETDKDGKLWNVGYQVKVDGVEVALGDVAFNSVEGNQLQAIQTGNSYLNKVALTAADKKKYEVRAVYYTVTDNGNKLSDTQPPYEQWQKDTKTIVKVGDWSEPFEYFWSMPSVSAVTELSATPKAAGRTQLTWKATDLNQVQGYYLEYTSSPTPIADFSTVKKWNERAYTKNWADIDTTDFGTTEVYDAAKDEYNDVENVYRYFRVCAYMKTDGGQEVLGAYSNICPVTLDKTSNTPMIEGLTTEKKMDGSFDITWNEIDKNAKVKIFYSTDKNILNSAAKEYTYDLVNAYSEPDGVTGSVNNTRRYQNEDVMALQDTLQIVEKKVKEYPENSNDGIGVITGTNRVSSDNLKLDPGKKYYFVVATVDDVNYATDRSATTPYSGDVSRIAGQPNVVKFGHYRDVVTSNVISAKADITIVEPSTKSGKTSITMNFDKTNKNITGYQILRKNSKGKYKKVATINSAQYVDKELKENTVYDYKVRGYYYNPDTKVTAYSKYVYFSAETSNNNYISLMIEKTGTTSVKLKWNKVAGATQYDIYRASTKSVDTNYSKKNGYGNGEQAFGNYKWEKIKTINKAKTVTYKDKKLKKGTKYLYRVVATYTSGKTTKYIFGGDSVTLAVEEPRNVKATLNKKNVKVTWDKDKFASKYEIGYIIYDAEDRAVKEKWTKKSTKKNYYTIKNIPDGGWVQIRVRAYGDKQWSEYKYVNANNDELAAAKNVTAKEITETNAKGEKSTAVKITWKKVSGAAYYKVYRSTSPVAGYNKDKKVYCGPNDQMQLIAREGNDDETYFTAPYKDYRNEDGTVVGTKAIDRARLQTGVTYYYYVEAYSSNGTKVSSGFNKPASICYKATPVISKVTIKKGKVTLKVAKVTGAKQYEIYRSTKKSKGYEKIGVTKKNKTTYTDTKVKKGKTYYYKVVAVGTNGLKGDFVSAASAAKKVKAK